MYNISGPLAWKSRCLEGLASSGRRAASSKRSSCSPEAIQLCIPFRRHRRSRHSARQVVADLNGPLVQGARGACCVEWCFRHSTLRGYILEGCCRYLNGLSSTRQVDKQKFHALPPGHDDFHAASLKDGTAQKAADTLRGLMSWGKRSEGVTCCSCLLAQHLHRKKWVRPAVLGDRKSLGHPISRPKSATCRTFDMGSFRHTTEGATALAVQIRLGARVSGLYVTHGGFVSSGVPQKETGHALRTPTRA